MAIYLRDSFEKVLFLRFVFIGPFFSNFSFQCNYSNNTDGEYMALQTLDQFEIYEIIIYDEQLTQKFQK